MKRFVRTTLILTITCVLSGCGITTISPQDKANLKTITINQNVQMPSYLSFDEDGSQWVRVFGIIGAMQAGQIVQSDEQTLQALMITHQISVQNILLGQMKTQLTNAGYKVIPNSPNVMNLVIFQYCFVSASNGFSSNHLQPSYAVQGQLTYNGRTIWQNRSILTMFSDFPSYTMTDFKNNPELLRQVWTQASQKIAMRLTRSISQ